MKPDEILYTGRLFRHKPDRFYGNRWKETWVVVLHDGTLMWYNDKHCGRLKGKESFRRIFPKIDFCESARAKFGEKTPTPPSSHDGGCLFVIPVSPKHLISNIFTRKSSHTPKSKTMPGGNPASPSSHPIPEGGGFQWFCTKTESDLADWIQAFATLLGEQAQYRSMQKALSDSRRENRLLMAARGEADRNSGRFPKGDLGNGPLAASASGNLADGGNNSQLEVLEMAAKSAKINKESAGGGTGNNLAMNYGYIWDELKASSKTSSSRPSISAPIDPVDYRAMVERMAVGQIPTLPEDDDRLVSASQVLTNSSIDATTARIESIEEVVDNVELVERRFRAERDRIFENEGKQTGGANTTKSDSEFSQTSDSATGGGETFSEADFAAYEAAKQQLLKAEVIASDVNDCSTETGSSVSQTVTRKRDFIEISATPNEPISLGWKSSQEDSTNHNDSFGDQTSLSGDDLDSKTSQPSIENKPRIGYAEPIAVPFQEIGIEYPAVLSSFKAIEKWDLDNYRQTSSNNSNNAIAMGWKQNSGRAENRNEGLAYPVDSFAKKNEYSLEQTTQAPRRSKFVITSIKNKDVHYAQPISVTADLWGTSTTSRITSKNDNENYDGTKYTEFASNDSTRQSSTTVMEHQTITQANSMTSMTSNTAASFNMALDSPTPFSLNSKRDSVRSFISPTPPPLPSCPPPEDDDDDNGNYRLSSSPTPFSSETISDPSNFAWFQRRLSNQNDNSTDKETTAAINRQIYSGSELLTPRPFPPVIVQVRTGQYAQFGKEVIIQNRSFEEQIQRFRQQQTLRREDSGMGDTVDDVSPSNSQTEEMII